MTVVGAATGFGLWGVTDWLGHQQMNADVTLALSIFVWVSAGTLLAMIGRLPLARAALGAALLGVVLAGMVTIAAQRYLATDEFLRQGYGTVLPFVMAIVAMPFLLGWLRGDGFPAPYPILFDETFTGVVRVLLALFAAGAMYVLVTLSSELFRLVGIEYLQELLNENWFTSTLIGALTGLSIAVVSELLPPKPNTILLRLLRLLVPFVLVVVVVFVLALPVNGFGRTFGMLSAASTLMAVAAVMLALITLVIGTGAEEPPHRIVRLCAKALSGLLPLVAGAAVAAVWLRVGQYGWTPQRLGAASFAVVLLGFGIMSALALLRGAGWDAAFRRGLRTGLMLSFGVGAVWLLPILRPEWITARSQEARMLSGPGQNTDAYWDFAHAWGRAGQAALVRIRDAKLADGNVAEVDLIERALKTENQWEFTQNTPRLDVAARIAALGHPVATFPPGLDLADLLKNAESYGVDQILQGCETGLPSGKAACVVIQTNLDVRTTEPETLVFYRAGRRVVGVWVQSSGYIQAIERISKEVDAQYPDITTLEALSRGEGLGATVTRPAISVGDALFYIP